MLFGTAYDSRSANEYEIVGPKGWQKNWNFESASDSVQEAKPPFLTGSKVEEEKSKKGGVAANWQFDDEKRWQSFVHGKSCVAFLCDGSLKLKLARTTKTATLKLKRPQKIGSNAAHASTSFVLVTIFDLLAFMLLVIFADQDSEVHVRHHPSERKHAPCHDINDP